MYHIVYKVYIDYQGTETYLAFLLEKLLIAK